MRPRTSQTPSAKLHGPLEAVWVVRYGNARGTVDARMFTDHMAAGRFYMFCFRNRLVAPGQSSVTPRLYRLDVSGYAEDEPTLSERESAIAHELRRSYDVSQVVR